MRRFAPDCFGGSVVYAPEDFGVNVDAGETIESSTEDDDGMWEVQAEPEPEIEFMAVKLPEPDAPPAPRNIVLASEASLKKLHTVGSIYYKDKWDDKRHDLAEHVSKGATRSSKELSVREVNILIDGIEEKIHTVEPEQEAMPL
jgi:hypothetical protein